MRKALKYTLYSAAFAICGMNTGCNPLDIENLSSFTEEVVWSNADLTTAYRADRNRESPSQGYWR